MKDNKNNQHIKKYMIYGFMCILCAGCIWLIFSPSKKDKEKEQQQSGFNSQVPDPKHAGIIGDKKTAYEQEQVQLRREEKMRSLEAYSSGLISLDEDSEQYKRQAKMAPVPVEYDGKSSGGSNGAEDKNYFQSSSEAYKDISQTLGNFYEQPKEDKEKEALKEEVELLKKTIAQQQPIQPGYDEQVKLLEKSYELAAKYMPSGQSGATPPTQPTVSATETAKPVEAYKNGKAQMTPIGQVQQRIVSGLTQPVSDSEFIADYSQERNMSFHTAVGTEGKSEKNTTKACISSNQTVIDGQSVRLRILEAMKAGDVILPKNSLITGICKIQGERLDISITSLEYEGLIIPVTLTVIDSYGQEGIFIPGSMEVDAIKEIAANLGGNLGTTINLNQQSAGNQLLTDLGKGAIQGTSQYIAKKMRTIKVHLKAGYNLMLYQNKNN